MKIPAHSPPVALSVYGAGLAPYNQRTPGPQSVGWSLDKDPCYVLSKQLLILSGVVVVWNHPRQCHCPFQCSSSSRTFRWGPGSYLVWVDGNSGYWAILLDYSGPMWMSRLDGQLSGGRGTLHLSSKQPNCTCQYQSICHCHSLVLTPRITPCMWQLGCDSIPLPVSSLCPSSLLASDSSSNKGLSSQSCVSTSCSVSCDCPW